MPAQDLLNEEFQKYLQSHPAVEAQLQKAERVYRIFGDYLNLTQNRVIIRESCGSTTESPNATLSRANY